MGAAVLSEDEQLGLDVDHSPPSGAKVNNEGGYVSTPCIYEYVGTGCGHGTL
jgi:hypothetical protein